jgi:hypothetical protein
MIEQRTERRRFSSTWLVVILAGAIILQAAAIAGVRTGTVISGSGTGKRTTVGTGVISPRAPLPQPIRGQSSAYFTKWGTHVENGTSMLTMYVAIDGARRVQKVILPNTSPNAIRIQPGPEVEKLAETLRIGDAVNFHYMIVGNKIYATGLRMVKPIGKGPGDAPFTLIGSKLVRAGKQKILTVTANAGVIPCTFRVPEEVDDQGRSRPMSKVANALKTFCRSDFIELEYKTVNYQFVLTGIKAARKTGQGTIAKILDKKIKGFPHKVAMIKTTKRTLTLVDPEAVIKLNLKGVENPSPDPQVQTTLKALAPGDYVMFKYRRQRAVYWLDEIHPTSRPDDLPAAEARGKH